jgi:hypothetical protein
VFCWWQFLRVNRPHCAEPYQGCMSYDDSKQIPAGGLTMRRQVRLHNAAERARAKLSWRDAEAAKARAGLSPPTLRI